MKITELYGSVTARIVADLEQGTAPWLRPWSKGSGAACALFPRNAATGKHYRGINILILWDAASRRGYAEPARLTFHQARRLGAHVRKGERGATVVFAARIGTDDENDDEGPSNARV